MTWAATAAVAAITTASTYMQGQSQKATGIRNANNASRAEGEAISKERLNKMVANSYSTAFASMQLALRKRQQTQMKADVSAARLAALGDAAAVNAATGSIGATTEAVAADIEQKADQAVQQVEAQYEMDAMNFNNQLDMMVLNTDQSAPNVRENVYVGPSSGEIMFGSVMAGLSQFASTYAMRKMSLGLGTPSSGGTNVPSAAGNSIYTLPTVGVRLGGA